jgi:putative glutamine amidotransferase
MKKQFLLLLIILSLIFSLFFCAPEKKVTIPEAKKIVLINPSSGSLESFIYLVNHQIIKIPNLGMEVVYDSGSIDRFESARRVIADSVLKKVQFSVIGCDLNEIELFKQNDCSENFKSIFNNSVAMLFFGGADIPPAVFGNKTELLTEIETPSRHYFEVSLLYHLMGGYQDENYTPLLESRPDYIIFGFCLGMQTLNVATGGSLYQDIPSEVYKLNYVEDILNLRNNQLHRNYWRNLYPQHSLDYNSLHQIQLIPGSIFTEELKFKQDYHPLVYSSHHQAVDKVGKGLKIEATSLDGKIVEALTHEKYKNVVAVQFHPENSSIYDETGGIYRFAPNDSLSISVNAHMIRNNSLKFHHTFWEYFSTLVNNAK